MNNAVLQQRPPHSYRLAEFVTGELNEAESAIVTKHVSECEECLTHLDQLWAISDLSWNEPEMPKLEPHAVYKLENALFSQIHRSSLGANTILLATKGFFEVLFAILKPLFGLKKNRNRSLS